jgi:MarR-like DNA-binding transcriptional regulator SgrR of sgrS sRNA
MQIASVKNLISPQKKVVAEFKEVIPRREITRRGQPIIMIRFLAILFVFLFSMKGTPAARSEEPMREVRTYMSYTWPIDQAKIITLPDMDLSYALASTLVEWGPIKQPYSGLAARWDIIDNKIFRFYLREGLKWSDGKLVTSNDVKRSFEHGMKAHPEDLRSLINLVKNISCPSEQAVDFELNVPADRSNLLGKLTEPNYGIIKISKDNSVDSKITTGAFFVAKGSKDELDLQVNPHYFHPNKDLAEKIIVRRMPPSINPQEVLLKDKWPNLIQISSLLPSSTFDSFKENKFGFWNRPTDRVFIFQLSPRLYNEEGKELFKFLNTRVNRQKLVDGLAGYNLTHQFFSKGFQLYDRAFEDSKIQSHEIPQAFKTKPLEILLSPERVSPILQENIVEEIKRITGLKPHVSSVPMSEVTTRYKKGDYDFYVGTVGLADPDPEGAMSFYFENDFRIIPNIDENFIARLDEARKRTSLEEKLEGMRKILSDATYKGHIVPLFHLSTMGIAREGIDLSQVPSTDESVTLSKIRFKEARN